MRATQSARMCSFVPHRDFVQELREKFPSGCTFNAASEKRTFGSHIASLWRVRCRQRRVVKAEGVEDGGCKWKGNVMKVDGYNMWAVWLHTRTSPSAPHVDTCLPVNRGCKPREIEIVNFFVRATLSNKEEQAIQRSYRSPRSRRKKQRSPSESSSSGKSNSDGGRS
eukprot:GHVN01092039.1.p1 GENE.GHVN01092039.1~~GHVN01092039.1.p1  ORF type:complete len:167 (+),score=15.29 GHVN01092039.1:582-1082(+)